MPDPRILFRTSRLRVTPDRGKVFVCTADDAPAPVTEDDRDHTDYHKCDGYLFPHKDQQGQQYATDNEHSDQMMRHQSSLRLYITSKSFHKPD